MGNDEKNDRTLTKSMANVAIDTNNSYQQIVILSDTHLPGENLSVKEKVVETINSWEDTDMVVVLGDIVATSGTVDEYIFAKRFLDGLNKPYRVIGGNHDYIYNDSFLINEETGCHFKETCSEVRKEKLELFRRTWSLKEIFYSERMGDYLLVFLTADGLFTNNYTEMSFRQLQWLDAELERNKELPTIIFFHGPLKGSYASKRISKTNPDSNDAEPAGIIKEILIKNKQVFLWVAGHKHIRASDEDFDSSINLYENQVWVIHNPTLEHSKNQDKIWTNSLFLYSDRVEIRTYDHIQEQWLKTLDRTFRVPSKM